MSLSPETDVRYLKGVGEKRAALYAKLSILTIRDLLLHFPRGYMDLSNPFRISNAPVGEACAVKAVLTSKSAEQLIRKGLSIFKLQARDETGSLDITIFNSKYTVDNLEIGTEYLFYGKLSGSLLGREMTAPDIYSAATSERILPIYPQTAGLSSKMLRNNIAQALRELSNIPDPLPEWLREQYRLPEIGHAAREIHFPTSLEEAAKARNRFIFEELLILSCALSALRSDNDSARIEPLNPVDIEPFFQSLPFTPTAAQRRCIEQAFSDMSGSVPMNRLIQGDVGSGKTLVAVACAYYTVKNGFQAAIMAPTEILAEQHYDTVKNMLEPFGMRVELLTGSTRAAERRRILEAIATGSADVAVGTHALISDRVKFAGLKLVVTDEQHRFGVAQRARLSQKSEGAHVLVMSATPIPRTLSLIIYGDLNLSILDEKPAGRRPVETLLIDGSKRARAVGFIKKELQEGRQAYIVCPLIEQGELDLELRPAVEYARILSEGELSGLRVELLHGRMKPAEKEDVMRRFKSGEIQALVSTTVVEVGVDVPNASVIMIENAERFGLSQLHQLRGRVGRSSGKSWCILVSDSRSRTAIDRLKAIKSENDGFKIAERDLTLRGPGDFFGYRQHGLPALRVADLADDLSVLDEAGKAAGELLRADPELSAPEHKLLRDMRDIMLQSGGDRPN